MKNNIMSHLSWNFDPCGERQKIIKYEKIIGAKQKLRYGDIVVRV